MIWVMFFWGLIAGGWLLALHSPLPVGWVVLTGVIGFTVAFLDQGEARSPGLGLLYASIGLSCALLVPKVLLS